MVVWGSGCMPEAASGFTAWGLGLRAEGLGFGEFFNEARGFRIASLDLTILSRACRVVKYIGSFKRLRVQGLGPCFGNLLA